MSDLGRKTWVLHTERRQIQHGEYFIRNGYMRRHDTYAYDIGEVITGEAFDVVIAMTACARCGEPATGYAYIGDVRYCHPDDPAKPDCYTLQCREDWDVS